jgi:hypothetical protein
MIEQLTYIRRQMEQRGITVDYEAQYDFTLTGDENGERQLDFQNQFMFLLNKSALPVGTSIISDTNSMVVEGLNVSSDNVEEFSGRININLPDTKADGTPLTRDDVYNFLFYHIIPK